MTVLVAACAEYVTDEQRDAFFDAMEKHEEETMEIFQSIVHPVKQGELPLESMKSTTDAIALLATTLKHLLPAQERTALIAALQSA
jgi:exonuclease VII small subunit